MALQDLAANIESPGNTADYRRGNSPSAPALVDEGPDLKAFPIHADGIQNGRAGFQSAAANHLTGTTTEGHESSPILLRVDSGADSSASSGSDRTEAGGGRRGSGGGREEDGRDGDRDDRREEDRDDRREEERGDRREDKRSKADETRWREIEEKVSRPRTNIEAATDRLSYFLEKFAAGTAREPELERSESVKRTVPDNSKPPEDDKKKNQEPILKVNQNRKEDQLA